ncbi:TPA: tail fiber assembly protein [Escherichia coli]
MFYSANTSGFYTPQINGENIPGDAVEITEDKYFELLQDQANGKLITSDGKGNPVAIDPPPPTQAEITAANEDKRTALRAVADSEIAWRQDAVDVGIATEEETAALAEWKKYRVLLMRVDTAAPVWPTPPEQQAS